jgi:hypothetical protein
MSIETKLDLYTLRINPKVRVAFGLIQLLCATILNCLASTSKQNL